MQTAVVCSQSTGVYAVEGGGGGIAQDGKHQVGVGSNVALYYLLHARLEGYAYLLRRLLSGIMQFAMPYLPLLQSRHIGKGHAHGKEAEHKEVASQAEWRLAVYAQAIQPLQAGGVYAALGGVRTSGINIGKGRGGRVGISGLGAVVQRAQRPHICRYGVHAQTALAQPPLILLEGGGCEVGKAPVGTFGKL